MLAVSTVGSAATINGSLSLNPSNLQQNGADLSVSTMLTADFVATLAAGIGDYSIVPAFTTFANSNLDLTNLASFTFTNGTYGTFTSSGGVILQQNTNFLDVFLLGTYSGLPGFDPTGSSLRISVNQSGASLSGAITLNSPALQLPEPTTMTMLGSSLIGLAMLGRKLARR